MTPDIDSINIDKYLKQKLDLMIKRLSKKQDNLFLIESREGGGKSNWSVIMGYYIAQKTGRSFSVDNIYFNAEPLIKKAQETEGQIFIYDEPALDMLSSDWYKKSQKDLMKLIMMARKKRHFFIFNLTKFTKFSPYLIDRAIGGMRIYVREGVSETRHFLYYKQQSLINLYDKWKSSKKLWYNKYKSFHGTLPPFLLDKIIDEQEYERRKDNAIMQIGASEKKATKQPLKEMELKQKIWLIVDHVHKTTGMEKKAIAKVINLDERTIQRYKYAQFDGISVENEAENDGLAPLIINNGTEGSESGEGAAAKVI